VLKARKRAKSQPDAVKSALPFVLDGMRAIGLLGQISRMSHRWKRQSCAASKLHGTTNAIHHHQIQLRGIRC
jgi:hypothetical protein